MLSIRRLVSLSRFSILFILFLPRYKLVRVVSESRLVIFCRHTGENELVTNDKVPVTQASKARNTHT